MHRGHIRGKTLSHLHRMARPRLWSVWKRIGKDQEWRYTLNPGCQTVVSLLTADAVSQSSSHCAEMSSVDTLSINRYVTMEARETTCHEAVRRCPYQGAHLQWRRTATPCRRLHHVDVNRASVQHLPSPSYCSLTGSCVRRTASSVQQQRTRCRTLIVTWLTAGCDSVT